jgi:predicted nucleic acid-binding protein
LSEALLVQARRVGPHTRRSLDAIHLTSALTAGADVLMTYDERLEVAAQAVGVAVEVP